MSNVQKSIHDILIFNVESDNTCVLLDCFRTLRNYCASGRLAQNEVGKNSELIKKTKTLVAKWLAEYKGEDLSLLVALQFVANLIVENLNNQHNIWLLFSNDLFLIINKCEPKLQNCAAMIIYNVILDHNCYLKDCYKNFDSILALTQHEITAEYATFLVELFICSPKFMDDYYMTLSEKNKLIVLSIVEIVQNNLNGRQFPPGFFEYLAKYVTGQIDCVLENVNLEEELQVIEVITILQIINNACSNSRYLIEVQSVSELLSTVIEVLGAVHLLSKEKGNHFSMLLKLSDMETMEEKNCEKNPVFGFKGSLVRLIGNMSWSNKRHQDSVRELGGIPLILDCCNIDARNPFIIQWAVLAMRNLCENNVENQKTVACIDNRGQLDTSRLAQLDLSATSSTKNNSK